MAILHLNLYSEYFDQIRRGDKLKEHRLYNEYWAKKLYDREYDHILIKKGYPKKGDTRNIFERPWLGFEVEMINHSFFGTQPVKVFSIFVNPKMET